MPMAAAGRQLLCGKVFAKFGGVKNFKKGYLLATCGGIENQPAKLELYECERAAKVKTTKLSELSFCRVAHLHHQLTEDSIQGIVLTLDDGKWFSFYPESNADYKRWSEYCHALYRIPNCSIPELPKVKFMKLGKCSDKILKKLKATSGWEVYIIDTGVGHVLNCAGKHVVTIHDDKGDAYFRINDERCPRIWKKSELRLRPFGYLNSMVYIEIPRHGLLWMYCPDKVAIEMNDTISKLINASPVDALTSSCDSGIGLGPSYCLKDFPETVSNLYSSCNENDFTDHETLSEENSLLCCKTPITCTSSDFDELNSSCTPYHVSSHDLRSHLIMTQLMISDSKAATAGSHTSETSSSAVPSSLMNTDNAYERSSQVDHQRKYPNSTSAHELENDSSMKLDGYWKQQQDVLWKCCPLIFHCLDVTEILPYLMSENLITENDCDILRNDHKTTDDKIHHLIKSLPKKPNLFKKFLKCLYQSSNNTGHAVIASRLKELIEEIHHSQ